MCHPQHAAAVINSFDRSVPTRLFSSAECVLDDTPGGLAAGIWFGFLIPIGLVLLAVSLIVWHLLLGVSGPVRLTPGVYKAQLLMLHLRCASVQHADSVAKHFASICCHRCRRWAHSCAVAGCSVQCPILSANVRAPMSTWRPSPLYATLPAWRNTLRPGVQDPARRSAYYTPTIQAVRRRRKRLDRAASNASSGSPRGSVLSGTTGDTGSKLWSVLSGKLGSLERVNSGSVDGSEASRGSRDDPGDSQLATTLLCMPPRERDPPSRSQSHNAAWQAAPRGAPRGALLRSASHGVAWLPPSAAAAQQQRGPPQRSLSHNVTQVEQPRGLLRSLSSDAWQATQRTAGLLRSLSSNARQPSGQAQRGVYARSLSSDARRWTEGAEHAQQAQHEPASPRVSDVPEERSVQLEDPLWQQWESQVAGQAAAAKAAAAQAGAAAAAEAAQQRQQLRQPTPEKRRRLPLGRWLVRYFLTPVFGWVLLGDTYSSCAQPSLSTEGNAVGRRSLPSAALPWDTCRLRVWFKRATQLSRLVVLSAFALSSTDLQV